MPDGSLILPGLRFAGGGSRELVRGDPINRGIGAFLPLTLNQRTEELAFKNRASTVGTTSWSSNGLSVSGGGYLSLPYRPSLDLTGGRSTIFFRVQGNYADQPRYANILASQGGYFSLFRVETNDDINVWNGTAFAAFSGVGLSSIFNGRKNAIAWVQDQGTAYLYINGVLRSSASQAGPSGTGGAIYFGQDNSLTSYYSVCTFDHIRVWPRALRPAEIQRVSRDQWAGSIDPAARLFFAVKAPASGVTGTLSATLAAATLASTATVAIAGTSSATLAAATLSATGTVSISGTASATLAATTVVAAGTIALTGSTAATLAAATLAGTGTISLSATLTATLGDATLAATGTLPVSAALAATLDDATLSADGTSASVVTGTLAVTLDAATLAAASTLVLRGTTTTTLANATLAGTGTLSLRATSSVTLGNVALSATGTNGNVVNAIVLVWNGVRI